MGYREVHISRNFAWTRSRETREEVYATYAPNDAARVRSIRFQYNPFNVRHEYAIDTGVYTGTPRTNLIFVSYEVNIEEKLIASNKFPSNCKSLFL